MQNLKGRNFYIVLLATLGVLACGEGTVSITDSTYQPKIVVQGTLVPGQIAQVRLRRNFPLNVNIDPETILLKNASAAIMDDNGVSYDLAFNSETEYYESARLTVIPEQNYTLEVQATIDGEELHTSATTRVPAAGFGVIEEKSRLGAMRYRERNADGELINFGLVFNRATGTDYYAASITALDADTSTFIYDNPFTDADVNDVIDDFNDYKYTFYWIQDAPLTAGESSMEIFSFLTWFYGRYRVILYAADKNFRDFLITHEQVQEIDGNFHEPAFHLSDDGIGFFGSAAVDTVNFEILRR